MQTPNVEVKEIFWDGTHLQEQRQSWRWIQPQKFWQNVERGGDSVGVGDVWSGGEKVVGRNETKRENREGLEMKQN